MPLRSRLRRPRIPRAVIASIAGVSLLAACSSSSPGGVEAAPQAFIDLLRGANTGKMVVKV